jgi:hypothetical protein
MLKPPLAPNLYEMRVAWGLIRLTANESKFVAYLPHEQAEVISFFRYVDPEPDGQDVERARSLLEGWEEPSSRPEKFLPKPQTYVCT